MTFERGFADVERAAGNASKSASTLTGLVRALEKAAKDGDLVAIDRIGERLEAALAAVRQDVGNARRAWPLSPDEVAAYLAGQYGNELLEAARSAGLSIQERDGRYVAFPSIVRVLPNDRAVQIDKKRVSALRPSRLAATLMANQSKKSRFPVEKFLESVYRAYALITRGELGSTVLLNDILGAFLLRPGSNAEYDQSDFTRDLYLLDRSDVRQTKSGARVSLPAATGTKGQKGVLSFVGPDGELVTYYGIRFEGRS